MAGRFPILGNHMLRKFIKFATGGTLVVLAGLIFNAFLVELLGMQIRNAYTLVVVLQVVLGYSLNKKYVFSKSSKQKLVFAKYIITLFALRSLDWLLYVFFVDWMSYNYLATQTANSFIFFIFKFFAYKKIFEGSYDK